MIDLEVDMYVPRASVVNCKLRAELSLVYPTEKLPMSSGSRQSPAFYKVQCQELINKRENKRSVEVFQSE